MTRKHFKAIAEALEMIRPPDMTEMNRTLSVRWEVWRDTVRAMANVCQRMYSGPAAFDRSRFYTACGYLEGE